MKLVGDKILTSFQIHLAGDTRSRCSESFFRMNKPDLARLTSQVGFCFLNFPHQFPRAAREPGVIPLFFLRFFDVFRARNGPPCSGEISAGVVFLPLPFF